MYLVIEIQKTQEGQVSHLVTTHTTLSEAESKFHQILTYAAQTQLASHAATILTFFNDPATTEIYTHEEVTAE